MYKDQLEQLLEKVSKEEWEQIKELQEIEIPEIEEMLYKVQMIVEDEASRNKKKNTVLPRFIRRSLKSISVAAAILICSFLFSIVLDLPQVEAFKFKMIKTMFEVQDNVTIVHQSNVDYSAMSKTDTPPPPPSYLEREIEEDEEIENNQIKDDMGDSYIIEYNTKSMTIEEAKKQFPARLLTLEYVPEGFELKELRLKNHQDDIYIVEQDYEKSKDITINVIQKYYSYNGDFASSMETSGDVKTIEVLGEKAILIVFKDRSCTVLWRAGQNEYEIRGNVSEKEMIEIIENLKLNEK